MLEELVQFILDAVRFNSVVVLNKFLIDTLKGGIKFLNILVAPQHPGIKARTTAELKNYANKNNQKINIKAVTAHNIEGKNHVKIEKKNK